MTDQKRGSFQDYFLSQLRVKKNKVEIHCTNGAVFEGEIEWFDNFTIILKYQGHQMMLYKHSIVAINPRENKGEIIKNQNTNKKKDYEPGNSYYGD
ncbi:MAG: RNA chaperone Hfq [Nitrospinae bacterium]|nr:RNA chaperone Hfq [Nitrospinota bacterium]